ncbi:MAG: serine/threonine-protein kinase [Spirulinaceae cyanobacterium]
MQDFPKLQEGNYQILSELGHNSLGGRVTYLANQVATNVQVVIKQFQFAKLGANWQEYETYEQELKMLRSLNHPSIPRYLDSFSTLQGFCLVQEYIEAVPLTISRNWTPDGIRQLALSILDILIYLQQQQPCIIHRDLKPENILIDEEEKVYLVDFGFARSGGGEVAVSSVVKGTLGFMPPEQLFNRQLTKSADLYGLGMTLICLLTGTNSAAVGSLIDANYHTHFRHLVPSGANGWLNWLETLVEPNPQERFADAKTAKEALEEIDLTRLPKLRLSERHLEIEAKKWGEKVTATLEISNPIPDTLLSGHWEVIAHNSDPPHTPYDHSWINIHPLKFSSNQQTCEIEVDTSKLLAGESYKRQLVLHSNAAEDSRVVDLEVKTPPLPKLPHLHYPSLMLVAGVYFIAALIFSIVFVEKLENPFLSQLISVKDFSLKWLIFFSAFGILAGTPVSDRLFKIATPKNIQTFAIQARYGAISGLFIGFSIVIVSDLLLLSYYLRSTIMVFSTFLGVIAFTYRKVSFQEKAVDKYTKLIALYLAIAIGLLLIYAYTIHPKGVTDGLSIFSLGIFLSLPSLYLGYKILKNAWEKNINSGFSSIQASHISLLTAGLAASIGAAITAIYYYNNQKSLSNTIYYYDYIESSEFPLGPLIAIIAIASVCLITHSIILLISVISKQRYVKRIVAQYQVKEGQLIKP